MPSGTKTRKFSTQISATTRWSNDAGKTWNVTPSSKGPSGKQMTVSEGHLRSKDGKYHEGGPFYTVRTEQSFPMVPYKRTSNNGLEKVETSVGTPMPNIGGSNPNAEITQPYSSIRSQNLSDLDPLGATAIAHSAPTNPYSNVATSLAEAHREGLPSLPGVQTWKGRTDIARAAGSEYLNAVFGWLPLVKEVKDVGHAAIHSHDILSQYRRDSGRNTRRSFAFPIAESESSEDLGNWHASYDIGGGFNFAFARDPLGAGKLTRTVHQRSRSWFEGCFTYAIPSSSGFTGNIERNASEANKLFGIDLTPDVLWELTPWSWAVDWFSNTGDVIHNFTSMQNLGLVMRYGYMMSEKQTTVTYTLAKTGLLGLSSVPASTVITTSKVRSEANPFGFGIGWEGLSASQLAITAALGITRLR